MGFDRGFTWRALGWSAALALGLAGTILAASAGTGAATVIVAAAVAAGGFVGLLAHVQRTNFAVARFVEAVRFNDGSLRVSERGGASFQALGSALNAATKALQTERQRNAAELRFYEALLEDIPVALLIADAAQGVRLANKLARGLFTRHKGSRAGDFAVYGEGLATILASTEPVAEELLELTLASGSQRAIVRAASLTRLGSAVRVVAVHPIQRTLDTAEVGAQTDLVRVLTHEILNSLTPVVSLAGTAAVLLGEDPPDWDEARLAVTTLARRTEATRRFIDSYRAVARVPEPRRRAFAAAPFAAELARLFAVEWLEHRFICHVDEGLVLDADPDLLGQALINLLRNAAQASAGSPDAVVRLRVTAAGEGSAIEVDDSGPGIDQALRGDVFLPFFTTKPAGNGVGLNLVRQIVVAHGWQIEIGQSDLGGASIRIRGM